MVVVHKQLSSSDNDVLKKTIEKTKGTENNENRHTSSVRREARNGSAWLKK